MKENREWDMVKRAAKVVMMKVVHKDTEMNPSKNSNAKIQVQTLQMLPIVLCF